MATIYVGPIGSGDGSGSSSTNAMTFELIDTAIVLAGPGGTVMMLADHGVYQTTAPLMISHGGIDGAPITIKGVDSFGSPMDVQILGTRAPIYVPKMLDIGNEVFTLTSGADNLVFDGFDFANTGTAFRLGADIRNITIQNMEGDNVRCMVQDKALDPAASATVTGLTVRDVDVHGFSVGVVTLRYDTSNVIIERVIGDSEYQDKDGIAIGIHLDGTVHQVLIKDTTMMNCISTGNYYNGDGFATERGVYGITFENCIATGNGDGGFDLKSTATTLINAVSEDNARNFRLWGEIELINPIGIDPHKRGGSGGQLQIQVLDGANVTVTGGHLVDAGSLTRVVSNSSTGTITFNDTHVVDAGVLTVGSNIFGLDPALILHVTATGIFSADGETYLNQIPDPVVVLTGTTSDDTLLATSDANWTVDGLAGNDSIKTLAGNDIVTGGAGNDLIAAGSGNDIIRFSGASGGFDSVDGGDGNDRIEATAKGTVIGLTKVTGVEAISSNDFGSVSIKGSGGADVLDFTNVILTGISAISGGGGNDTISGSAAADVINGAAGADIMRGNGGADRFDFNAVSDSRPSARDQILDFQQGTDKLDLVGIDANSSVSGNQVFTYIGALAFTHEAGQIKIDTSDSTKTMVLGDVNGDGLADFAIQLSGNFQLNATDLLL